MTTVGQPRSRSSKAMRGLWNPTGYVRAGGHAQVPLPARLVTALGRWPTGIVAAAVPWADYAHTGRLATTRGYGLTAAAPNASSSDRRSIRRWNRRLGPSTAMKSPGARATARTLPSADHERSSST